MPSNISQRNLTLLSDQLFSEICAYKKADQCAQSMTDPALQQLAEQIAEHHVSRFNRLYNYLQNS